MNFVHRRWGDFSPRLGPPYVLGDPYRLAPRMHSQLAHQALDMAVHRGRRQHEPVGDVVSRRAGRQEIDDLPFTGRETASERPPAGVRHLSQKLEKPGYEPGWND